MRGSRPLPPFAPSVLRLGRDLRMVGIDPVRKDWHRVRRGVWLETKVWERLTPEQRHAAEVHAAAQTFTRSSTMFCRSSAAAVLGMPRIDPWPRVIHILVDDEPGSGRAPGGSFGLHRHRGTVDPGVTVAGLRVTTPARTVIDLARFDALANALTAADYALRVGLCTRANLLGECLAIPRGGSGRRAARLVVDLAEAGGASPGESLSRLQMFRANLPRPVLQQDFRDARGLIGYTDFYWPHVGRRGVIGEFDGHLKYRVDPSASPHEVEETLWQEKQREDRLRKQADVARWIWPVATSLPALVRHLGEHGIRPLARNGWFDEGRLTE
ncbi:MAG: hypothetical protein U0Q21_08645 [Dermatophilaceae bacterium]